MLDIDTLSGERMDARYLSAQFVGGTFAGCLVLGMILYLDLSGLWTLISRSDMWLVASVMLGKAFAMTFGIAATATSVCGRGARGAERNAVRRSSSHGQGASP